MSALPVPAGAPLIMLLVDRSGSMASCRSAMEAAVDGFLREQKSLPGTAAVMMGWFDDKYEVLWKIRPLADVPRFALVPRGGTALYDSIGRGITDVNEVLAEETTYRPVIFVVVTDGHDNASIENGLKAARGWIEYQRAVYKWEFVFLGANLDAVRTAGALGIPADHALTFKAERAGATFTALHSHVAKLRAGAQAAFDAGDRRRAIGA